MRKLLFQLLLLLGSVGLVAGLLLLPALRRPYLDAFYTRFTTPPAASLVIGTSRAAQAVLPTVLQARLGQRFEGPWLNYAFTLYQSPYGPSYLASIQRKLAPNTHNGLFVVAVDPWSLSVARPTRARPPAGFPEDKLMIGQLRNVSQNPNLDYLVHYINFSLYRLLLHDTAKVVERLHPDGWLEIALPSPLTTPARTRQRETERLATYHQLAAASQPSAARLASLHQLITFLKGHGRVVLVRVPTGQAMTALEAAYQPDFDQQMQQTSQALGVPYLNYAGQPYLTTDGNHLWRGAAHAFSLRLAEDIDSLTTKR
ncbi:hypothetical protein [Hymenobacter baengnokdamensis]|uniref:hypothetical protein n=1 Tax=Hymenobacter baengnokdamensis TaxID=2615203 RepID=UPI0012470C9B|nr:hypothetical protein [Hymenobacter baengnokdamensis]